MEAAETPFTPEQEARIRAIIAEILQNLTSEQAKQIIAQIQAQMSQRR